MRDRPVVEGAATGREDEAEDDGSGHTVAAVTLGAASGQIGETEAESRFITRPSCGRGDANEEEPVSRGGGEEKEAIENAAGGGVADGEPSHLEKCGLSALLATNKSRSSGFSGKSA